MDEKFPPHQLAIAVVFIVVVATMLPSLGCDEEKVDAPDEVAESFLNDMRRGERERGMEAVWPPTRDELESAHGDLEVYFDGDAGLRPSEMLLVTRLESPMLIDDIDVRNEVPNDPDHGQAVPLAMEFRDGRTAEVVMRWGDEKQRWYVDLPVDERRALQIGADDNIDQVIDRAIEAVGHGWDESKSVPEEMTENE